MRRRSFLTRISALLALLGVGGAERNAAAAPLSTPETPTFKWVRAKGWPATYPDGGVIQSVETLEGVYRDWRYTGRLIDHRLPSGRIWRFDVELDWKPVPGHPEARDPRCASSWASDLEETRARAELALTLLIDTRRLENHCIGPFSSLELLSAQRRA